MTSRLTSCLYYPFSRCMNPSTLKQMLLIFEEVNFLDPVNEEDWRAKLFEDMATNDDKRFSDFDKVKNYFPLLISEKAVVRQDPSNFNFSINSQSVVASAISDLSDVSWIRTASNPAAFGLPSLQDANGNATWQMFRPKIPNLFLESAADSNIMGEHVYEDGGTDYAWSLSYAAGSALAINAHLSVAEELGLAPITDSALHQRLLEKKANRGVTREASEINGPTNIITARIATSIVESLIPHDTLSEISFEEILRFRNETKSLRGELLPEILECLASCTGNADTATQTYKKNLRDYQSELTAARNRLWPRLIPSGKDLAAISGVTTALTITASHFGSPGMIVLASIVPAALAGLKVSLDFSAHRKNIENSASPGISYLSKIARL